MLCFRTMHHDGEVESLTYPNPNWSNQQVQNNLVSIQEAFVEME